MAAEFDEMYREHVSPIWRYVRARLPSDADAEDVTSEVFAQAMRTWQGFDPSRGSVGGWLVGIARHALADWWRRRGREVPTELVEPDRAIDGVARDAMLEAQGARDVARVKKICFRQRRNRGIVHRRAGDGREKPGGDCMTNDRGNAHECCLLGWQLGEAGLN